MYTQGTSRGQALVIVILLSAMLMAAGGIFIKIVLAEKNTVDLYIQKEKCLYLAEAGLEEGKAIIAANPNWFTDMPHGQADDIDWLINDAAGSTKQFGGGRYKMVRETGKSMIYSVGYFKKGIAIVRTKYAPIPFKAYEFKVL